MAFLEVVGEAFGFSDRKGWSLVGQDAKFTSEFKGQFIVENLDESIGSNLGETTTVGKQKPDLQWLNGETEVVTFDTRLFASNSVKNIKQQIELLKSFARRNDQLKRSPIFLFTAGTEIGFTCFVRGVKLKYDELRSDGSLRGVICSITLQKIQETVTKDAATSLASQIKFAAGVITGVAGIAATIKKLINIPGGSLHTIDRTVDVKQGMTFERIAATEYGNALLGDILRRTQPGMADLKIGDKVQLVEASEIIQIPVTQQAVSLANTREGFALREEFLAKRNRKTTIFV